MNMSWQQHRRKAFRATIATPEFVNAGTVTDDATGNFTLNAPSSPQNGDIWIAVFSSRGTLEDYVDSSNLSDWNFIVGASNTAGISVAWFRYSGSSPDLTATWGGTNQICAGIAAFRGCVASGSPIDTTGSVSSGTDGTIEIAGITPTASNCLLLAIDVANDDNSRTSLPSGFAAAFDPGSTNCLKATAGADASVAIHYKSHTSGATGDFTDTMAASNPWSSVLIALKP